MRTISYRHIARMLTAAVVLACIPATASAQDYFDDDIYYSPKKDKEKQKQAKADKAKATGSYYNPSLGPTYDYPGSDTYTVNSGSTIDVDTYNRHGQFLVPDSVASDSVTLEDFANTRRIERFHNPDIVSASGDEKLIDYYTATPAATGGNVNIYVMDTYPYWGNPYRSPYSWAYAYGPSWGWSFGPSWSWGWGYDPWYDPYWSWGWGGPAYWPGYYPGYWPGYYPPYPGWGGPAQAWRPTGPGSSRPHYPSAGASSTASRRHTASGSNGIPASTARPGGMGSSRGRTVSGVHGTRTSSGAGNYQRPQQSNDSWQSTGTGRTRGRNGAATNSNSTRRNSNSYDNSNSWRNNSSFGSSRGSGGGFGGGYGGGSHSGGGGGGSRGRH